MIKHIEINNFKSLVEFSIDLTGTSYIVGNNGTGKSNFLQAIDFLTGSVNEDFDVFLERRGWSVENIKSKLSNSQEISFKTIIVLDNDKYEWYLSVRVIKAHNKLQLRNEYVKKNGEIHFQYENNSGKVVVKLPKNKNSQIKLDGLIFHSSFMKNIAKQNPLWNELGEFIEYINNTRSYELLSPEKMRLSSRGKKLSIGASGKDLPAYIKSMSPQRRAEVERKLEDLLKGRVNSVGSEDRGRPGWTQVVVEEKYQDKSIKINSKEMSDGFLRLLAFIVISTEDTGYTTVLLDEVENGINLEYAESIVSMFKEYSNESNCQLILTTHNTVILDYVDSNDIIYFFRDDNGRSRAVRLFDNGELKEQLPYMYPGEVLLNKSNAEVISAILAEENK